MVMPQLRDISPHREETVHNLALMTGIICIAGFGLDLLAMSLQPTFSSIEWRMGFMQQIAERCIILLFGGALLCYGLQTMPAWLNRMAWVCCGLGLCMSLSGFFYLQDSVRFKSVAIENLSTQQQNLEQRIQQFTPQPRSSLDLVADPARKEKAVEILRERTQALESSAKVRIQKTVTRTFSSLLLSGTGLVILGRTTLRSKSSPRFAYYQETALQSSEQF